MLAKLGGNNEMLDLAMSMEEKALADDYFVERKLYPNVDFYTGLIYKAMGFPEKMFTVLFAIGRLPGWIAQWRVSSTWARASVTTRPPSKPHASAQHPAPDFGRWRGVLLCTVSYGAGYDGARATTAARVTLSGGPHVRGRRDRGLHPRCRKDPWRDGKGFSWRMRRTRRFYRGT